MSKGTKIVPIRVPPELLEKIDHAVFFSTDHRKEGAWTRSSWIVQAIKDKLAHAARSNDSARRRLARAKKKAAALLTTIAAQDQGR